MSPPKLPNCPSVVKSVQVRAHCRRLPKRRPFQFNQFVLENACREQTRRYAYPKRAGASSPQGA